MIITGRVLALLLVFQQELFHAEALRFEFVKASVIPGEDIVVTWTGDPVAENVTEFTLNLVNTFGNDNTIVLNQTVATNGTQLGQVSFSSKNLGLGYCYVKATDPDQNRLVVLGVVRVVDHVISNGSDTPSSSPKPTSSITSPSQASTSLSFPTFTSSIISPSQVSTSPSFPISTPGPTNGKDRSSTFIIGAVLGSVLGLGLVVFVGLILLKRRRNGSGAFSRSFLSSRMLRVPPARWGPAKADAETVVGGMTEFKYGRMTDENRRPPPRYTVQLPS